MSPQTSLNMPDDQMHVETDLNIDYHSIKKAAIVLRSLNHKLRQQIIRTISEAEKLTVTQLYVNLRLEQSVASQHLAILRRAGIVSTRREGKYIYYTINHQRVKAVKQFVKDLVN